MGAVAMLELIAAAGFQHTYQPQQSYDRQTASLEESSQIRGFRVPLKWLSLHILTSVSLEGTDIFQIAG